MIVFPPRTTPESSISHLHPQAKMISRILTRTSPASLYLASTLLTRATCPIFLAGLHTCWDHHPPSSSLAVTCFPFASRFRSLIDRYHQRPSCEQTIPSRTSSSLPRPSSPSPPALNTIFEPLKARTSKLKLILPDPTSANSRNGKTQNTSSNH